MSERDWQKDWELCEKATSGPWKADREGTHFVKYYITVNKGFKERVLFSGDNVSGDSELDTTWEDTVFVAEAREALPYWLQRVRELEEQIQRLQQWLREEIWYQKDREKAAADYIKELEEENRKLWAVAKAAKLGWRAIKNG